MRILFIQTFRFAVVGTLSNGVLYLLYLIMTYHGWRPKVAMSLLYLTGVLQTFIFNKWWTFSHHGCSKGSLIRYLLAYGGCYFLNLWVLDVFVDHLYFPHEIVQAVNIVTIAVILFILQKFWVFRRYDSV